MKIYLVPFLLDFLLFLVQLRLADASGRDEMSLSNSQATALLIAFSVGYMAISPFMGQWLNLKTTKPIMLTAIASIGVLSIPLLFTKTFLPSLLLIGLLGVVASMAFNAFQAMMRGRTQTGGLALAVGKYNVAWSLGIALGFLSGGIIKSLGGPIPLSILCVVATVAVFLMVVTESVPQSNEALADEALADENAVTSTRAQPASSLKPFVDARYIAIGWSLCLAANFVQRPLATFLPKFSAQEHNPAWMAGLLLFTLMFMQACSSYMSSRREQWCYTKKPLFLLQFGIMATLISLWIAPSFQVSLLLVACLGLLHGFSFFSAVFYVGNSVRSARNVGINETMVAVGNISGMLLCDRAIAFWGNERAWYPMTIAFSLLLLIWQMWHLRGAPVAEEMESIKQV